MVLLKKIHAWLDDPVMDRQIREIVSAITVHDIKTPVVFQNGWANFGSIWETMGYYKDQLGVVHFGGLVAGGTITAPIWTFPVGYRPTNGIIRLAACNNGTAELVTRFNVYTTGVVNLQYAPAGYNTYVSIFGEFDTI